MRRWMFTGIVLFAAFVVAGCQTTAATPSPTPSPTQRFYPSFVQRQMDTATPTRTPRPSPTVTPIPPPLPTIAPEFWATVGAAPDTLIALQTGLPANAVGDIAVMSIDGTHYQQLTTYGYNRDPRLSPDRQRIAYLSVPASIVSSPDRNKRLKEGNFNVWVISVDGAQTWKLTDSELPRSVPDWSADSRKVLFSEGLNGALIEIEVDAQARREITRGAYSPRYRPGGGVGYITQAGGLAWTDESQTVHILVAGATLQDKTRVSDFVWLSDGQHVIYTLLDERGDDMYPYKSSVWIIGIDELHPTQLKTPSRLVYDDLRPSTDARFVMVRAHGYGDACAPSPYAEFLALASDRESAQSFPVVFFAGLQSDPMGYLFPISDLAWISDQWAIGHFQVTCADGSLFGWYLLNSVEQRLIQITRD